MTENQNQTNFFTVDDIYKHVDTQQTIDITKVYDPLHFWEDYGDKYYKEFKKPQDFGKYIPWLIEKLRVLKVDTLYDAGCGFCRVEPFLIEAGVVKEITAIDISQKQLDSAKEYLTPKEPKKDSFNTDKEFAEAQEQYAKLLKQSDQIYVGKQTIKWSNTPANSYDCTMSIECMQHLPLTSVRYAIRQLEKLARKYVVVIERFVFDGEHPAPHIWSHNYMKLATDIGLKPIEASILGNGMTGMVFKK